MRRRRVVQQDLTQREVLMLSATHFTLRQAADLSKATATLLLLALSYVVGSSFNPFIYFRF
ncbi:MAG: hypothetical protein H7Z21_15085 [Hymenobacter sp.]|nr:hypothetical protein [Hymenobacter sp.]